MPAILRFPPDARLRLGTWALVWLAWTALGAGEAALLTVGLGQRGPVFGSALLVFVGAAWLWVAAAPFVVALARALPWPGASRPLRATATVALHLAGALLIGIAQAAWLRFAWMAFTPRIIEQPLATSVIARLDLHLFTWLAIVAAVHARGHWARLRDAALATARVRGEVVRTRLHVLTMQLQPHFLFNTLHGISELVHRDPDAARRTARHLRDLLGQSFAHAAHAEVTLREELRFLESYLGIQRTRFGPGLDARIAVPPALLDARVPCLVLQPLVENAIRHGVAPRGGSGRVEVGARRVGDRLELRVRDDGRGLAGPRRERQGTGNTRLRLEQLYGREQHFDLRPADGGGAEAVVSIPWRTAEREAVPDERHEPAGERRDAGRSTAALLVIGIWAFWAVTWTLQSAALGSLTGPVPGWLRMSYFNVMNAVLWAVMTPLVAAAVRRWPARRERAWARLAPHVVLALAAAGALALLRWQLFFPGRPFIAPGLGGWWAWDVTTYVAVAGFVQAAALAERRRAHEVALASLEADLALAQLDAIGWELRPERLGAALDEIADAAATDPDRADELTTNLGELLREMLMRVSQPEPVPAFPQPQRMPLGIPA